MSILRYLFILIVLPSITACTPSIVDKLQQDYACSDKGGVPDGKYSARRAFMQQIQCMNGEYINWWNIKVPVEFIEQHKNNYKETNDTSLR